MRPFLAFDTATDHVALAVGDLDAPGVVMAAADFAARRAANTVLLPAVERLLDAAGLGISDVAAVACGRGPGSFTGVRIAVATAKGLAHALGVPLVGFGTLDAVAARAGHEAPVKRVAAASEAGALLGIVGDAMRGEVYPALFRVRAEGLVRLSEDRVAFPADVAAEWASLGERVWLAGAGLAKHRAVFEAVLRAHAQVLDERCWSPDGASLVAAAWAAAGPLAVGAVAELPAEEARALAAPGDLQPVYTRLSDAEEAERGRARPPRGVPPSGVAGPDAEGER